MSSVQSCAVCAHCEEIDWADKRNALRCMRDGRYQGRITQVFTRGCRSALKGLDFSGLV